MSDIARYLGQAVCYAAFMVLLGYFATDPMYQHVAPNNAMIRVSFTHATARLVECKRLSPQEIAALPPRQRKVLSDCARERAPMRLEVSLDGALLYQSTLQPSGLSRDGSIHAYEKFEVPEGHHELVLRMRDSVREEGFDHEFRAELELQPGENMVIDFRPDSGGFVIL
ncbi:MAG: hypothetical protein IT494_04955 [Gammaproteobacteria bacterium]|nr:hypothetical protein [Gammaproteobacteria bacterium]